MSVAIKMDITQIYAISAAGLALSLLLRSGWWSVASYFAPFCSRMFKYLTYSYVLRRHALIGPWTAITVLAVMICVAINIVCLTLGTTDWSQAARRAGTLSIINLGALFSGLHLNFLASLLGLSLATVRVIHRSASLIALSLAGFHIVVGAVTDKSAFQRAALKPSALIVRFSRSCTAPRLITLRLLQRCVCSRSFLDVSSRGHPTKYSYGFTRWPPSRARVRSGAIYGPTGTFPASFCTSSVDCSAAHSSGKPG